MSKDFSRRRFVAAAAGSTVLPLIASAEEHSAQTFLIGFAPEMGGQGTIDAWWSACDGCTRLGFRYVETNNGPLRLVETFGARPQQFKDEMARRKLTLTGLALFKPMSERSPAP